MVNIPYMDLMGYGSCFFDADVYCQKLLNRT